MEFQANYFAACLLMPRTNFTEDLLQLVQRLGTKNRGFGILFVDNQSCNQENYRLITSRLMTIYGVSRTAATIRLETLGLLQNDRNRVGT